jgi:predicted glycosyltransferase
MTTTNNRSAQPRIMMYSQDGFGLGHMRRTSSIASQITQRRADVALLTLADSRLGHFFETGQNHDYLKLPSILKAGPGDWRAVNLPLPFADVRALRQDLIRSAVQSYQPHLLLVDHMPHGAMGELIPTLEALKESNADTKVVLGLRDILDAPEVVRRRWQVEGAYEAIENYYDMVLVYGRRDVFDLAQQYGFSPTISERLRYCGYVCTPNVARYTARARAKYLAGAAPNTRLIVAMAGGGADGYPMMRMLLDALPAIQAEQPCILVLITGPFMPPELRRDLEARARGRPARVSMSVSDTLSYIDAADLVVAMAGYNTTMEILRSGRRAILIPRAGPSAEQRMRTQRFAARGWVEMIDPDDLHADTVARSVLKTLRSGVPSVEQDRPDLGGLACATDELLALLPPAPEELLMPLPLESCQPALVPAMA